VKMTFEMNAGLVEDFPEVIYPIRRLEGIANRCKGQTYEGKRTYIEWTKDSIILPSIEGSAASAATLKVAGITGRIRGMQQETPAGEIIRPDLVILDDPQTDESARSLTQCDSREILLAGAILNLAGPKTKISGIMPCTVICPGDMADRLLDRKKHPDWRGERMKLVYDFPTNTALWDKYAEIQAESLEADRDGSEATEFYGQHRAEMDEGARIAWDEYFEPEEISALQHAMNLKLKSDRAHDGVFWAEYQNEPQLAYGDPEVAPKLLPEIVYGRVNNRPRGIVPQGCEHLSAYIDVQDRLLYYLVAAWRPDFTGFVVDYGTYPEQPTGAFTARDAPRTLKLVHRGAGAEGAIYAGLGKLTEKLLAHEWRRDDGVVMHIGRCLVDAGWQSDVVYDFCRQATHAALLMPAHGAGITASQKPISEYDRKRGDTIGEGWWIPASTRKRALRHLRIDTNYWKTFIYERITTAVGDKGALTVFGDKPQAHRLLADHLCAEYRVRTQGRGRKVDEWKNPAHQPDNHWWDCLVGSAAAASMLGSRLTGPPPRKPKPNVPLAERWRMAREKDGKTGGQ
ncbi:MAG TPA: terminase gpA endonuclease subunit, partial [Planctomycetota bacterium]|nr:terminase gpA endonuclease subunit [Planctomycetota bacterium]